MVDQGKISTYAISLFGVILAYIIANPSILEQLMGTYYIQYGAVIITLLTVVYNYLYPRNTPETVEEPQ